MTKKFSLTPYLFLAPALLVIAVFVVYPIVAVFYYSFTEYNIVTPPEWVGLANYQKLLTDRVFWQALKHSFTYLLVTPTLIVLSILLAIVVNRKLPGINIFRTLFFVPVISGSIAVGIAWRLMWDTNGIINGILISLNILKEPMQWLAEPDYTLPIAMLLTTWLGVGYYMMIFLAGLQSVPEELYDFAADPDGLENLAKNPAAAPELARLRNALLEWMQDTRDPLRESFAAYLEAASV